MSSWFCRVHEKLNTVYILYDSIRPASIPEKVKKEEEKKEEALKEEVKEAFGGCSVRSSYKLETLQQFSKSCECRGIC